MGKFRKIFVTFAAAAALAFGGASPARAQWVISDPAGLVQQILGIIEQSLQENGPKLIDNLNDINDRLETIKKLKQYAKMFRDGGRVYTCLYEIGKMVDADIDLLMNLDNLTRSSGYPVDLTYAIPNLLNGYRYATKALVNSYKEITKEYSELLLANSAGKMDEFQLAKSISEICSEMYYGYYALHNSLRGSITSFGLNLYARANHQSDAAFIASMYY